MHVRFANQNSSGISVIPRVGCTTLEVRTIREGLDLPISVQLSLLDQWRVGYYIILLY